MARDEIEHPNKYINGVKIKTPKAPAVDSKGLPIQGVTGTTQVYTPSAEQARLLQQIQPGLQPTHANEQLQALYEDPTNNPIFQRFIGGILDALAPSEEAARRELEDTFRRSGAIGSGAQAVSTRQLEGDILGSRGRTIAQNAGDIYSRLAQSLGLSGNLELAPYQLGANVLSTLGKYGTITKTGEEYAPETFTGFGGGFGSSGGSSADIADKWAEGYFDSDTYFPGSPFGSSPPGYPSTASGGSRGLPYPTTPSTNYDPYINFGYTPEPYNLTNANPGGMWTNY